MNTVANVVVDFGKDPRYVCSVRKSIYRKEIYIREKNVCCSVYADVFYILLCADAITFEGTHRAG